MLYVFPHYDRYNLTMSSSDLEQLETKQPEGNRYGTFVEVAPPPTREWSTGLCQFTCRQCECIIKAYI